MGKNEWNDEKSNGLILDNPTLFLFYDIWG